jgi:hypothetical protein
MADSPRERMTKAAAYLRQLARDAEYKEGRWFVDVAVLTNSITFLGPSHDVLTATWPQAALVDMCSPAFVRMVADLLDVAALSAYDDVDHSVCDKAECSILAALELADQILKVKGTTR